VAIRTVLELGAGLGLCSVAAKLFGAAEVVATDLQHALPGIAHTAALNNVQLTIRALDWTQPYAVRADLVVLSDVVWVEWLVEPLVSTLKLLLGRDNRAVMCYKVRSVLVDQKFRGSLREAGLRIEEIATAKDHLLCQITANSS